jgi:hypothetical protein
MPVIPSMALSAKFLSGSNPETALLPSGVVSSWKSEKKEKGRAEKLYNPFCPGIVRM